MITQSGAAEWQHFTVFEEQPVVVLPQVRVLRARERLRVAAQLRIVGGSRGVLLL